MRKNRLIKWLGCLAMSAQAAQAYDANLDTTAAYFVLQNDPTADLQDTYFQSRLGFVKQELDYLLKKGLISESSFMPLPFEKGLLVFELSDAATAAVVDAAIGTDGVLEFGKESTGVANLDLALRLAGATQLKKDTYNYELSIPEDLNPKRIALFLKHFGEFEWVEDSGIYLIGGPVGLSRLEGRPTLYRHTTGWGDCPAGCIYNHNVYIEVQLGYDAASSSAKIIAEGGDPLPTAAEIKQ